MGWPITQPAAAPKRAWCPATCPPTAPTAAPFKQPLALAGTDVAAIKANRAKVKILDFMGFPVRLEAPVADVDPLRAATCCLDFASVDLAPDLPAGSPTSIPAPASFGSVRNSVCEAPGRLVHGGAIAVSQQTQSLAEDCRHPLKQAFFRRAMLPDTPYRFRFVQISLEDVCLGCCELPFMTFACAWSRYSLSDSEVIPFMANAGYSTFSSATA